MIGVPGTRLLTGHSWTCRYYSLHGLIEVLKSNHLVGTCMKLAPSVVAAYLIGGTAIHNFFFGLDIDCNNSLENGIIQAAKLCITDVLVIDEFSVLDLFLFQTADWRKVANIAIIILLCTKVVGTIKLLYKKYTKVNVLAHNTKVLHLYKKLRLSECFSDAQRVSYHRAEILSASDWSYILTASTSADLVGGGSVCWSQSFSISRRQLSETRSHRVSIAVRRPWLSDSITPMFIHCLLTGSKSLNNVGRVSGLSELVFVAEAAPDEPCVLPLPPDPPLTPSVSGREYSKLCIATIELHSTI